MISSNLFPMLISSKYEFFEKIRQKELDRKWKDKSNFNEMKN